MPDTPRPEAASRPSRAPPAAGDKMLCDRCGNALFRMHAVRRCPACGDKTDCCGW